MKKKINQYKKHQNIETKIEKRYNILIVIITLMIIILFIRLFYIQVVKHDYYKKELIKITERKIEGGTAPRGRIYDRNYKLIVDNEPIKIIYYEKPKKITTKEEIETSYKLAKLIDIDVKITENMLKTFWLNNNRKKGNNKITEEEYRLLDLRKLTDEDILKLKKERITKEELDSFEELDIKAAYIYYLMNKGYSYQEKIIKSKDISDLEYAKVASNINELNGVNVRLDWKRIYPYQNTFKSILGTVSESNKSIPSELEKYYLKKGYNINDRVGTSYLEYEYDDYLKGIKNIYEINDQNEKVLSEIGNRGNDIVLTIDIELQEEIEKIIEEELIKTKKEKNTKYFSKAFVVITNPKTGEILAMSGKEIKESDKNYKIYDYTPGIVTSPITAGSVVKGASHIVGYNNNALKINEKRYDNCVKLKGTPLKCSWMPLGLLNDITALKKSSNTYQYYTAMKVANTKYIYNVGMPENKEAFSKYRRTFNEFGLGVKTEIDLPVESIGNIGKSYKGGLLLDFAIGQYDTYTPIQLSQYISTIANNGIRMQPHLLKEVYDGKSSLKNKIFEFENKELNKVNTDKKYLEQVKKGFKEVLTYGGTGSGYIDLKYKPAGKTGTSQSFIDIDGDLKIDKETISTNFVAYAPYSDPTITFTVVTPDVYYSENGSTYQSNVNRRIVKRITDTYFKKYYQK